MSAILEHQDLPGGKLDPRVPDIVKLTLTPELASYLLSRNYSGQRSLSKSHKDAYVSDLKQGTWHRSTTGLGISYRGELMDGQHRCAAVIASGEAVETFAVTGLTDSDFRTIDNVKPRSMGDVIGAICEGSSTAVAALTGRACMIDAGYSIRAALDGKMKTRGVTNDAMVEKYHRSAEQIERIQRSAASVRARVGHCSAAAVGVAFYVLEHVYGALVVEYENVLLKQETPLALKVVQGIMATTALGRKDAWPTTAAYILEGFDRWAQDNDAVIRRWSNPDKVIEKYDRLVKERAV